MADLVPSESTKAQRRPIMRNLIERARIAVRRWLLEQSTAEKLRAAEALRFFSKEQTAGRVDELRTLIREGRASRADEMALMRLAGSDAGLAFVRANNPNRVARREAARRKAETLRCPGTASAAPDAIPPASAGCPADSERPE